MYRYVEITFIDWIVISILTLAIIYTLNVVIGVPKEDRKIVVAGWLASSILNFMLNMDTILLSI